jgi:probable rRNA maturation factor
VLSFPGADGYAGDIALAYGVTKKEAKAAGKTMIDHATHLVVHGVLHLAGHDHERPKEAKAMESLEVKILERLGIADPYAVPGAAQA